MLVDEVVVNENWLENLSRESRARYLATCPDMEEQIERIIKMGQRVNERLFRVDLEQHYLQTRMLRERALMIRLSQYGQGNE